MKVCQFKDTDLSHCWEIIGSILHLGNIQFDETEKNNMPVSFVKNRAVCGDACSLLLVSVLLYCMCLYNYAIGELLLNYYHVYTR